MTIALPSTADALLLWSQLALTWTLVNVGRLDRDELAGPGSLTAMTPQRRRSWLKNGALRAAGISVIAAILPGMSYSRIGARLALAALTFVMSFVIASWARLHVAGSPRFRGYLAQWDVLAHVGYIITAGWLVAATDLTVYAPMIVFPARSARVAAITLCFAAIAFMLGPATQIVRTVLDKAGTLPRGTRGKDAQPDVGRAPLALAHPIESAATTSTDMPGRASTEPPGSQAERTDVDVPEYNRGRTIGNIERVIMMAMVALGSYEALGFLMAAKGLIRASEFEDRNFAEYFIVGSLSSAAIALLVGSGLGQAVRYLWGQ